MQLLKKAVFLCEVCRSGVAALSCYSASKPWVASFGETAFEWICL